MASDREERKKATHFKVMRLLDQNRSITTREIARQVGVSNGAAHYCVTALIQKGLVKIRNFTKSGNKSNYFYELTPQGISVKAALTVQFLDRKREEYENLKAEIERLENDLRFNGEGPKDDRLEPM